MTDRTSAAPARGPGGQVSPVQHGIRPMWCDRFDLDLPRVVPEAREIVGDLGDVLLSTFGHTTDGALNHPAVWNGQGGLLAFFGFQGSSRPPGFVGSGDLVRCTAWEAIRDAWPHGYLLHVERVPVWDTLALRPELDVILRDVRGWDGETASADAARRVVRSSLERAIGRFHALVDHFRVDVERHRATESAA